ncbi:MAG: right-handed parallel beta-helix repeat-containing protein, partial [Candidatus Hodarchaeales archaeon]
MRNPKLRDTCLFFIIILNILCFDFAVSPNISQNEPRVLSKRKIVESGIIQPSEDYPKPNLTHYYLQDRSAFSDRKQIGKTTQKEISSSFQKPNLLKNNIQGSSYTPHDAIGIEKNTDFSSFPGAGTINNPFRIENFSITGFDTTLISVANTNVHFRIKNNLLDGSNTNPFCIYLYNVSNCVIEDNIILNSMYVGILLDNSTKNLILNNTVSEHGEGGLWILHFSNNNQVVNNTICNNALGGGINIDNSQENLIYNNTVYGNQGIGISSWPSNKNILFHPVNNQIINNTVYNNEVFGIYLEYAKDNLISNNTVYGNQWAGIYLNSSNENYIRN